MIWDFFVSFTLKSSCMKWKWQKYNIRWYYASYLLVLAIINTRDVHHYQVHFLIERFLWLQNYHKKKRTTLALKWKEGPNIRFYHVLYNVCTFCTCTIILIRNDSKMDEHLDLCYATYEWVFYCSCSWGERVKRALLKHFLGQYEI